MDEKRLPEVFEVEELAAYLKTTPATIYKLVRSGELPGFKLGGGWRFRRETVERWIEEKEGKGSSFGYTKDPK